MPEKTVSLTENALLKIRLYTIGIIAIFVWSLLAWDYFHDGVPTHHLLARADMPGISNWWGGLLLPLLSWLLLYRIQKRDNRKATQASVFSVKILYAFLAALAFGILLSFFFTTGSTELTFYMMIGLLTTGLFLPIYRAECFLGFILGMTFTFGGVLPIVIISVFSLIGAVLYLGLRPVVLFIVSKTRDFIFPQNKL